MNQAYSTQLLLAKLQQEKKIEEINNSYLQDGSIKKDMSNAKLKAIGDQIAEVENELNQGQSISGGGIFNYGKRDAKITGLKEEEIGYNAEINDLNTIMNSKKTFIGKKVYKWKIDAISKKLERLRKKKGRVQARQRRLTNVVYAWKSFQRNRQAKKSGKIDFYDNLTKDMRNLEPTGFKLVDGLAHVVSKSVTSFSGRRIDKLNSKLARMQNSHKPITFQPMQRTIESPLLKAKIARQYFKNQKTSTNDSIEKPMQANTSSNSKLNEDTVQVLMELLGNDTDEDLDKRCADIVSQAEEKKNAIDSNTKPELKETLQDKYEKHIVLLETTQEAIKRIKESRQKDNVYTEKAGGVTK